MGRQRKKDRAIIFAPFQSLQGFFDLIKEQERVVIPKKELAEDALEDLDRKIHQVKLGEMIKIVYYDKEEYVQLEGMVAKLDLEFTKTIQIVKKKIELAKIVQIEFP